jgi:hypothetical protein
MPRQYTRLLLVDRFWALVDTSGDCWEWTASRMRSGYGRITVTTDRGKSQALAHRVAYELTHGPIPAGLVICHRCDNPACVRPDHLFADTQAVNMRDMTAKGRRARGERQGLRLHPECAARGERVASAKLTAEQVREIRRSYEAGELTQKQIGRKYGVSQSGISLLIRRLNWRHVE